MRVAIVHDWLYILGGAERVLSDILQCYPDADVFTLFDVLTDDDKQKIGIKAVKTSFLNRFPKIAKLHRFLLPLMPIAIEQFDFSDYDLVISSSYAVAKGVLTGPDQVHVSYVHSPMRYAWDLQHEYLKQSNMHKGIKSALVRMLLGRIRIWDVRTAHGPDLMLANSAFVARRIKKIYGREAPILNPPVAIGPRREKKETGDYFFAASRLVPYKNIHLIVEAISKAPDLKLVVAGTGPEEARLKAIAGPNVEFKGFVTDNEMRDLMAGARAFIFAAEEDFGIVPVEAQMEGTPVIAYGRGGALETVKGQKPGRTGMFFDELTPDAILSCVRQFVAEEKTFDPQACRLQAELFSSTRFRMSLMAHVAQAINDVALRYPSLPAALRHHAAGIAKISGQAET